MTAPSNNQPPKAIAQAFVDAAWGNEVDEIRALAAQYPALVDPANPHLSKALLIACSTCQYDSAVVLVEEYHADVNAGGDSGLVPLLEALDAADMETAKMLVKNGADVNVQDGIEDDSEGGLTPLHYAVFHRSKDMVCTLLLAGADKDVENNVGETPAEYARGSSSAEFADLIDLSLDEVRKVAQARPAAPVVDPLKTAVDNFTAAIWEEDVDAMRVLAAQCPALVDPGLKYLSESVSAACSACSAEPLKLLVGEYHADISKVQIHGLMSMGIPTIKFLIQYGADINALDEKGRTPLHCAVFDGDKDIIRFLLLCDANPSLKDAEGFTPAQLARKADKPEIADMIEADIAKSAAAKNARLFKNASQPKF